jgi:hypothetical protein
MSCRPATLLKSGDFWLGLAVGAIIAMIVSKALGLF